MPGRLYGSAFGVYHNSLSRGIGSQGMFTALDGWLAAGRLDMWLLWIFALHGWCLVRRAG